MFQTKDKEMLHQINENEYFFDRDGKLFRYILQYYRNKKLYWPTSNVSKEELMDELDFWGIAI